MAAAASTTTIEPATKHFFRRDMRNVAGLDLI
jgi:hypothetical protein